MKDKLGVDGLRGREGADAVFRREGSDVALCRYAPFHLRIIEWSAVVVEHALIKKRLSQNFVTNVILKFTKCEKLTMESLIYHCRAKQGKKSVYKTMY